MFPFVPGFVSPAVRAWSDSGAGRRTGPAPRATIAEVANHIDHIRKVAGVDHVGIGADFDGISETVQGLGDVSTYPALFLELVRRGWTEPDLRKLAGENLLRAMERAEQAAARLARERPPSTRTIEELDRPRR